MTGILQIFDRYKTKPYAKNESRRSKTGESVIKTVPKHYLVEGDAVVRRAPSDQAWSEVSRDSHWSSSADITEVMVKTSASSNGPYNVQKSDPTARPSIDFPKPRFSTQIPCPPGAMQDDGFGFKESSKNPESYTSDAGVLKFSMPSSSSVSHRSKVRLKPPSRDLRNASKSSAHLDALRTTMETIAHLDDASDISRAVSQTWELVRPSFNATERLRHAPPDTRRDSQRYHRSGDEREGARYHRDGHHYQSSGDEKDSHQRMSANDSKEAQKYSLVTAGYREQVFDDVMDHHRPEFPSEAKEFLHSWHVNEGCKDQASNLVKEPVIYTSSGNEMDNRGTTILFGSGRRVRKLHEYNVRRDSRRHRSSPDPESNRSYWPVDTRDIQRHQSASDSCKASTGDEKFVQRPFSSTRRRRSLTLANEKGHKYSPSNERGEGRRQHAHDAGRESQCMHSSGHNRGGRRSTASKDTCRDRSSANSSGYKHQSGADPNEHQKYQSAGEVKSGYKKHMPTARGSNYQPRTGVFTGRRYPSSGVCNEAHRIFASAREREDFEGHDPSVRTFNGWRNESSDEDREVFLQHIHPIARDDLRSYSSIADAHRRLSLGNYDRHKRYSSSNDERRRDRSRSSVKHGRKLESTLDSGGASGEYGHLRPIDRAVEWVAGEANVARSLLVPVAMKEVRRRSSSVDSRGERRHRDSNSSVAFLEPAKFRLSVDNGMSNSKDEEFSSGFSRDLPPRSSARDLPPRSPRDLVDSRDLRRLNVQVKENSHSSFLRDSYHGELGKSAMFPEQSQLSSGSVTGSHDFREILRALDFKDSLWGAEKLRDVSSRNSTDGRDPPRTSNVSRVSVDSRQYQSSTPRLSVDGREHLRASSLHSSRATSVDAQVQHRTNSMDSSASGEFNRRGPGVIARLMGVAELPVKGTPLSGSDKAQIREGKSLQKLLNKTPSSEATSPPTDRGRLQLHLTEVAQQMKQVAARLHQDSQLRQKSMQASLWIRPKRKSKTKSKMQSRSRSPPPAPAPAHEADTQSLNQHQGNGIFGRQADPGSPLPRQPMSPKHHQMEGMPKVFNKRPQEFLSGDFDHRLHQLRIKNSIQEHRTLKQILEAMHLKGLLHPPQRKPPKSPREVLHGQGYLREEEQRPLQNFTSSRLSEVARTNRKDFQEQLTFEDLIRIDSHGQEEPTLDNDHSGEASIVLMKPVNYRSSRLNTLPAAIKEVDSNSEISGLAAFEKDNIEIGDRGRGSERRTGSSGRESRSHSLESLNQRSADKEQVEDLSFANVMFSWRERIAADAAKKATMELAETKSQTFSKSTPGKHRSREVSPLQYETRDSNSIEKRAGSRSPKVEGSLEESIFTNRQEYNVAQENGDHEEDRFKMVGCRNSDHQLSASTAEALAAMDASSDSVPAQASVLRHKLTSGKSSRRKDKLKALHREDLHIKPSPSPSISNLETSYMTGKPDHSSHLDLNVPQVINPISDSKAPGESLETPEVNSRIMPKKRKTAESVIVIVEKSQLPPGVASKFEVKDSSHDEGDDSTLVEKSKMSQDVSFAGPEPEDAKDDKMEDPFSDGVEVRTPEGFSSGREKCLSGDGSFILQGTDFYPSPVSVLDSPMYQEEFQLEELIASPGSVKSSMAKHADVGDIPQYDAVGVECENEPEILTSRSRASKEISDPLRDIYTKLASTLELSEREICRGQLDADPQILFAVGTNKKNGNATEVISGDRSKGKLFVQSILIESGLTQEDSRFTEGASEIMHFGVFTTTEEKLQTKELQSIDRGELEKSEELRYKESLDRRLIFDCMNEILERKMKPYLNPQPWGIPVVRRKPSGQRLIDEVWDELKDLHWPTTADYDTLYAVLQKDFMRKGFQCLEFSVEVVDVGCELERIVLQELVEEVVQDLISLETKPVKELCEQLPACPSTLRSPNVLAVCPSPLSPPDSPSSPPTPLRPASPGAPSEAPSELSQAPSEVSAVSPDDSERRRRELLDKTRRDLLAWHVQYQQL